MPRTNDLISDIQVMNYNAFEQANHSVYSNQEIPDCYLKTYSPLMGKKDIVKSDKGWVVDVIEYDRNPNLSFVKPI